MALYFLSRFAFVTQIPRQEDFGAVDFLGFLGKESEGYIFGEDAFFVQIKSSKKDFTFKGNGSKWIRNHMNLPLLLCHANKTGNKIDVYSTFRLWPSLALVQKRHFTSIKFILGKTIINKRRKRVFKIENKVFKVGIGKPIVSIEHDELEDLDAAPIYWVLKDWLSLDNRNVAALRTHKGFSFGYGKWETNSRPNKKERAIYYPYGVSKEPAEKEITNFLTSLCVQYKHPPQEKKKLKIASDLLGLLPREYLNSMGRWYADKKYLKEFTVVGKIRKRRKVSHRRATFKK